MTHLEAQIADLEAKAAEFMRLAEQATDPVAQGLNVGIAQELYNAVDVLKRSRRRSAIAGCGATTSEVGRPSERNTASDGCAHTNSVHGPRQTGAV
jgi:hypothetical protein